MAGPSARKPAAGPSAELRIEAVTPAFAPVIAALHGQCFSEAWDGRSIETLFDALGAFALVGSEAGGPAAFILGRIVADECEILALGVVKRYRRQGFGRAMLAGLSAYVAAAGASRIVLEVATDNVAARALYAAHGFVEVGRRRNYYERPCSPRVDGLILSRRT